jgi:hypothetical protein
MRRSGSYLHDAWRDEVGADFLDEPEAPLSFQSSLGLVSLLAGARSAAVDTSWGTVGDANGDGFADVIGRGTGPGVDACRRIFQGPAGTLSPCKF